MAGEDSGDFATAEFTDADSIVLIWLEHYAQFLKGHFLDYCLALRYVMF